MKSMEKNEDENEDENDSEETTRKQETKQEQDCLSEPHYFDETDFDDKLIEETEEKQEGSLESALQSLARKSIGTSGMRGAKEEFPVLEVRKLLGSNGGSGSDSSSIDGDEEDERGSQVRARKKPEVASKSDDEDDLGLANEDLVDVGDLTGGAFASFTPPLESHCPRRFGGKGPNVVAKIVASKPPSLQDGDGSDDDSTSVVSSPVARCQFQKVMVDAVSDMAKEQKNVCFQVVVSIVDSNF
jgi:hypothetical protein